MMWRKSNHHLSTVSFASDGTSEKVNKSIGRA